MIKYFFLILKILKLFILSKVLFNFPIALISLLIINFEFHCL